MNLREVIHSQSSDYISGDDEVVVTSHTGYYQWLNSNLQEKQEISNNNCKY